MDARTRRGITRDHGSRSRLGAGRTRRRGAPEARGAGARTPHRPDQLNSVAERNRRGAPGFDSTGWHLTWPRSTRWRGRWQSPRRGGRLGSQSLVASPWCPGGRARLGGTLRSAGRAPPRPLRPRRALTIWPSWAPGLPLVRRGGKVPLRPPRARRTGGRPTSLRGSEWQSRELPHRARAV